MDTVVRPEVFSSPSASQELSTGDVVVQQLYDEEPPPYQQPQAAPPGFPKYVLDPSYVAAKVGDFPALRFTVTSSPPLPENTTHTLTHENGQPVISHKFKIIENKVIFSNVQLSDTGRYTISCRNTAGLVGTATIELVVTPSVSSVPAQVTTPHNWVVTTQPTITTTALPIGEDRHVGPGEFCLLITILSASFIAASVCIWALPCFFVAMIYGNNSVTKPFNERYKNYKKSLIWTGIGWITCLVGSVITVIVVLPIVL